MKLKLTTKTTEQYLVCLKALKEVAQKGKIDYSKSFRDGLRKKLGRRVDRFGDKFKTEGYWTLVSQDAEKKEIVFEYVVYSELVVKFFPQILGEFNKATEAFCVELFRRERKKEGWPKGDLKIEKMSNNDKTVNR